MNIHLNEVKNVLQKLEASPEYIPYLEGVRRFLRNWHRKTRREIIGLCQMIKQAIDESFDAALRLFGSPAVFFFKRLQPDEILWP